MTTISDIRAKNKAAGYYYFERSTMRFFDSKVLPSVYEGPGGIYFVTSEQFHGSDGYSAPRQYSVRKFNPETGDINTAGEFNKMDRAEAQKAARQLAKGQYE